MAEGVLIEIEDESGHISHTNEDEDEEEVLLLDLSLDQPTSPAPHSSLPPGGSRVCLFAHEDTGTQLRLVFSTLGEADVEAVRDLMAVKCDKGFLDAKVDVAVIQTPVSSLTHTIVFYCLLSPSFSHSHTTSKFIVCFVFDALNDDGVELFRSDVEQHARELERALDEWPPEKTQEVSLPPGAVTLLQSWYYRTILYLCRSVVRLADSLPFVIHAAAMGRRVVISGERETIEDVARFVETLRVAPTTVQHDSSVGAEIESPLPGGSVPFLPGVVLRVREHAPPDVETSSQDTTINENHWTHIDLTCEPAAVVPRCTNPFCSTYAASLQEYTHDPTALRRVIEEHMVSLHREINDAQRRLGRAVADNCALYTMFRYMADHPNSDVLFHLLEHEVTQDDHVTVLQLIREEIERLPKRVPPPPPRKRTLDATLCKWRLSFSE